MPDGDIVRNGLRRIYQKPYEQICEGKATSCEFAKSLLKALKKDLEKKGNLAVILAQDMANIITQAISAAGNNGSVDYVALNMDLDRLIQQTDGRQDIKELILRAGRDFVWNFRYGQRVNFDNDNLGKEILKQYMKEVFESEFKSFILINSEHYAGADQSTVTQRIEEIQSDLDKAIDIWATKAITSMNIEKLKLPSRSKVKEKLNMEEEDLTSQYNRDNQNKINLLLNKEGVDPLQITMEDLQKYLHPVCKGVQNET